MDVKESVYIIINIQYSYGYRRARATRIDGVSVADFHLRIRYGRSFYLTAICFDGLGQSGILAEP